MIFRDLKSEDLLTINRIEIKNDKLYMIKILKIYGLSFT